MRILFQIFSISSLFIGLTNAYADVSECSVPLDETLSAPASDVIENGASIDRDLLLDQIKGGLDSSTLEPQLSDLYKGNSPVNPQYQGTPQPLIQYANIPFPNEQDTLNYVEEMPGTEGLVRARVTLATDSNTAFQMNFSLDTHAALARNALLRKLGYAIPSPKYYSHLKVKFGSKTDRDSFINDLAGDTATDGMRWVDGGAPSVAGDNLVIGFHDIVLENVFLPVPQMHWGILSNANIDGRRSIRGMIVPLTLLDIYESVNIFSYETAKVSNGSINFDRMDANAFKNESSIGDVKWISKKIALLNRDDWTAIIQAGHYPADIQALVTEKVIGRVDQLMGLLQIPFKKIPYNEHITIGKVIKGKATQEFYDGYAPRFAYGDPLNPLRASELARFFSIEAINGALSYGLTKANTYLQAITEAKYVSEHDQKFYDEITQHAVDHPTEPFVAPVEVFGGPTVGGNINASRNIVSGTYYGNSSQVQLVDTISAGVNVAGFFGVAGLKNIGLSFGPAVQYSRSYVHVRPLSDIKTAFKDNWAHIMVPAFMAQLSDVLTKGTNADASTAITNFLGKMATGEMFIVSDGLSSGGSVNVSIPLSATLGLVGPFSNLTENISAASQYAILSRTTIYRTADGIHVYVTRMQSGSFEMEAGTDFFIRILDASGSFSKGKADTKAYVFPDTFSSDTDSTNFKNAMVQVLRRNNPSVMETYFHPYDLEHTGSGSHFQLTFGPWSWSKRQTLHRLEITPPVDPQGRYDANAEKRTVWQGDITKISGNNFFGFFTGLLSKWKAYLDLGQNAQGDDPSANFLGNSKTLNISTEIETTPSRQNHTYTKIEQSTGGWIKSKDSALKIVNGVQQQLGAYSPTGGLIDSSVFASTKKVEAFTIVWDLMVYEQGTKNAMKLLDINNMTTGEVQYQLIQMMGQKDYEDYCALQHLPPKLLSGPFDNKDAANTRVESSHGQTVFVACAPPLMAKIYDLRQSLAKHPEMFNDNIRSDDDAKSKIKTTNATFNALEGTLSLEQLITLVGKENSFFQVRISGFRTNDEGADFNSVYFSNTIGIIDQTVQGGPLSDIADVTKISSHEVEARYMSDGF